MNNSPQHRGGAKAPREVRMARAEAIRQRYPTEGPQQIARDFGVTPKYIQEIAERMKVRCLTYRQRAAASLNQFYRQRPSVDVHFFDEWSVAMAYTLGWVWADGCVQGKPRYRLRMVCVTEDDEIIRAMVECMRSTHKVDRNRKPSINNGRRKNFTQVCITSKPLVDSLMFRHGVLPRKTYLDLPFPEVPEEYLAHFVRGYFDGDGSVSTSKDGWLTVSFCGTPRFLKGLQDRIAESAKVRRGLKMFSNHGGAIWRIFWRSRSDVQSFARWLCPPGEYMALTRKRLKLQSTLTW